MEHRFTHRLAGNRAGIDAGAAQHFTPLDQRNAFIRFGGLNGSSLPGRTRADNNQIKLLHKYETIHRNSPAIAARQ